MNVALIIADDWSPLAACYENPIVQTPHTDRLAARSTVFTRAFCTTPSCAASRASILTGMYSHRHRQYGHSHGPHHFRTRDDARTLPAILNEAGMQSALVGKTHIAPESAYPFTIWPDQPAQPRQLFSNDYLRAGTVDALKMLGAKPFYLHVASGNPHRVGGTFDPAVCADEYKDIDVTYDPAEVIVPDYFPDTPAVRQDLADYYKFVTRFDHNVGMVLEELERAGRIEDTMIILLSDHGMPFPGAKASPFEAGHHCPLIIAHPDGTGAGQTCDALVNWCDILPTALEAMEVPEALRPDLSGESLMPLLRDAKSPWRDLTFYSHSFHEVTNYFPYRIARGNRYKYVRCLAPQLPMPLGTDLFDSPTYKEIQRTGGSPQRTLDRMTYHCPEAFFDLEKDPNETTNLIDDPELQPLIKDYRDRLTALRKADGDVWLEVDHQEGRIAGHR